MKKLILLFAFAYWTGSTAQTPVNNKDSLTAKKIIVTTSLTDYIPRVYFQAIRYNIGVEVYLKDRKSIYASLGYIYSNGYKEGFYRAASYGTQGVRLQVEGRYYFQKHKIYPAALIILPHLLQFSTQKKLNTGYYTGINTFHERSITHRETPHIRTPYDETIKKAGLFSVFGYQCQKKSKLIIDQSIGFGVLILHTKLSNGFSVYDRKTSSFQSDFTRVLPELFYNFRIGF